MHIIKLSIAATLLAGGINAPADQPAVNVPVIAPAKQTNTADWYKDAECRMVFFTVLEGLYMDGISQEVVDLVIGHVEKNNLKQAFVFRCKLCHACYEAFAAYQRRPAFNGTDGVNTIGTKKIDAEIIAGLRKGDRDLDRAFSGIIQPWIKQKLVSLDLQETEKIAVMKKFAKLASEGNALITGYRTCQACKAIETVAKTMKK